MLQNTLSSPISYRNAQTAVHVQRPSMTKAISKLFQIALQSRRWPRPSAAPRTARLPRRIIGAQPSGSSARRVPLQLRPKRSMRARA